jgi:hypothetical protein
MSKQTFSPRLNKMHLGYWKYIQIQAEKLNLSIPEFINQLAELHARTNHKAPILHTLIEEYNLDCNNTEEFIKEDIKAKLQKL